MSSAPLPVIFAPSRRRAVRRRMIAAQRAADAPRYLLDDMIEDVLERLAFLRRPAGEALVVGDYSGTLPPALEASGWNVQEREPADGFDEEKPFAEEAFDLVASLGTLDSVNDLPGALIHIRRALRPGGLMIAEFPGAGSLAALRTAMLAGDGERPAARLHPAVNVRAGGQLLQRAGFADPVVDSRSLDVGFRSLDRLVGDLRAQGLSSVLANRGPALDKAGRARAQAAFAAEGDGARTVERFEILTLSGWRR